jgi:hypothetical protein
MGGRIPELIRRKVLREWLEGVPRPQIARENQIGTGTVSEIIKTIREMGTETQIDALRDIALMLRRQGLSIDDFANSIRLKRFLDEIGLTEEKLEDFARHLDIYCFKRGLTPDTFMDLVANISSLSDKLGIPVEELPEHINKSKELHDNIDLIRKQKEVMTNYDITMADLEEFRRNRPLAEALKSKNMELEKAETIIYELRFESYKRDFEWRVSEHEIQLVNTQLERPIESEGLYKLAQELVHHPSKYADIIRTMCERSTLHSTLTN